MIKIRCSYSKDILTIFYTHNSICLILLKVLAASKQIGIVSMKSTTFKISKDKRQKSVNVQSNHTQNNTLFSILATLFKKKISEEM